MRFVFTPGATLEDLFKAVSIFVGYQTLTTIWKTSRPSCLNSDNSWDGLYGLLSHLNTMGTVKQDARDFLLEAEQVEDVISPARQGPLRRRAGRGRERTGRSGRAIFRHPLPEDHAGNVCVFCSASIDDPAYLSDGYELGKLLAESNFGCVSGAGNSGIMGEVVRGSVECRRMDGRLERSPHHRTGGFA